MILPFEQATLLETSIDRAKACCARIILVLGYRAEELMGFYEDRPEVTVVVNPTPEAGLLSSVQAGLQQVQHPYVFLTHGDMPRIEPQTFLALWAARGADALFPTYDGQAGHPVLLPRAFAERLGCAKGYSHPKQWLLTQPHRFVAQSSPGILFDIDTPEQYQQALEKR